MFVGRDILYLNVFKRNDNRTIYNVIYRDGKVGYNYIKRFAVTGVTRDKEYDITKGTEAETPPEVVGVRKGFQYDRDQRTRFDGEYPDKGGCA